MAPVGYPRSMMQGLPPGRDSMETQAACYNTCVVEYDEATHTQAKTIAWTTSASGACPKTTTNSLQASFTSATPYTTWSVRYEKINTVILSYIIFILGHIAHPYLILCIVNRLLFL